MLRRTGIILAASTLLVAVMAFGSARAAGPADEAKELIQRSSAVLGDFMKDRNFEWMQQHLKDAKAVLVFPRVIKAGFIWGGSGGNGVLSVRDETTGAWSQPAFYSIGSVSFGLQAGGQDSEVVMLAMNRKAVDSLYASSFKLAGSIAVAAGPHGVGAKRVLTADFLAFTRAKGLYAGVNLEGSGIQVRDDLNSAYYGKEVRPVQIIREHAVTNAASEKLLEELTKAAR